MKWDSRDESDTWCSPFFSLPFFMKTATKFYMRIMHVGDGVEHVNSDKAKFV